MSVRQLCALMVFAPALWADLTITTTSLPNGTVGEPYSAGLGSNSSVPVLWGASGLPPGLVLGSTIFGLGTSATILGIPNNVGSYSVTVTAGSASANFSITIAAPPALALTSTSPLPAGIEAPATPISSMPPEERRLILSLRQIFPPVSNWRVMESYRARPQMPTPTASR